MNEVNEGESRSLSAAGGPSPSPHPSGDEMPDLGPTALALLKHWDVHLFDTWEPDAWGDPVECVQVFAPRPLSGHLAEFVAKTPLECPVRIYEGSPPPF